jgi:REP element-mobilizing transposase RayT
MVRKANPCQPLKFPKSTLLPAAAYGDRAATFHVTISAHPEISVFEPNVANVIWREVTAQIEADRIELLAACLMPDHLHMLARPRSVDIHTFVGRWKSHTTRRAWTAGHVGPLWQPKMWDRTVRDSDDLAATFAYILDNPVRSGLVDTWEAWPWSWASEI